MPFRPCDASLRRRDTLVWLPDTPFRLPDTTFRLPGTRVWLRDASLRHCDASLRLRDTPLRLCDTPLRLRDTPFRLRDAPFFGPDGLPRVRAARDCSARALPNAENASPNTRMALRQPFCDPTIQQEVPDGSLRDPDSEGRRHGDGRDPLLLGPPPPRTGLHPPAQGRLPPHRSIPNFQRMPRICPSPTHRRSTCTENSVPPLKARGEGPILGTGAE